MTLMPGRAIHNGGLLAKRFRTIEELPRSLRFEEMKLSEPVLYYVLKNFARLSGSYRPKPGAKAQPTPAKVIPTRIQQALLPTILSGRDVLVQAETGVGKTTMMCLAAANCVDPRRDCLQVVILSPTWELASQIGAKLLDVSEEFEDPFRVQVEFGGAVPVSSSASSSSSASAASSHQSNVPHVISTTPGTMRGIVYSKKYRLDRVKLIIGDEADKLFEVDPRDRDTPGKSFLDQTKVAISAIPRSAQLVLLSASLSGSSAQNIIDSGLLKNEALCVRVDRDEVMPNSVKHYMIVADKLKQADSKSESVVSDQLKKHQIGGGEAQKIRVLILMALAGHFQINTIIFCPSNELAEMVARVLNDMFKQADFAIALHGRSKARNGILSTNPQTKVVVSSGALSRGVELDGLRQVVMLSVASREEYQNNAGRVGR